MSQTEDGQLAEAEAWKRKYYDALEQHDTRERQWIQADELLRKTLSRLTLAADGQDTVLDRQLKELRDAIRDRADSRVLRQRIETMSESLVRLDSQRIAKAVAPKAAAPLQLLLDKLELPRGHARRLKALRRRLEAAESGDLHGIIAEFAELLQQVLTEATADDAATTGGGLLGRLFGRNTDRMPAAAAENSSTEDVAAPLAKTAELGIARALLLHLLDQCASRVPQSLDELRARTLRAAGEAELKQLAEALALVFQSPGPAGRETGDGSELLLQLLERLDLPTDLAPRVAAIKDRLEDRAGFDAPAALRDIATLIADMRTRLQQEKHDIEAFLKQLTDRLQDIDSYVRGAEVARAESYQSGRDLGDVVQLQVRGIEDSVRAAQSLDHLKHAVQQRIEAIIVHVDQHRRGEEQRHRAVASQVVDLTERLRAMEAESALLNQRIQQEHHQALTDSLTGIPNRLAYQERIAQEFARWKRFATPLALLIWDVDRFKQINDRYGHKAGDKVLKVISGILAENIRETDFLARYGGEEFILLMTGTAQPAIHEVAEKLRNAVDQCGFHYRGEAVPITVSCGIAEFCPGDGIDAVFDRADRALYRAKDQGRNRCVIAD